MRTLLKINETIIVNSDIVPGDKQVPLVVTDATTVATDSNAAGVICSSTISLNELCFSNSWNINTQN